MTDELAQLTELLNADFKCIESLQILLPAYALDSTQVKTYALDSTCFYM